MILGKLDTLYMKKNIMNQIEKIKDNINLKKYKYVFYPVSFSYRHKYIFL